MALKSTWEARKAALEEKMNEDRQRLVELLGEKDAVNILDSYTETVQLLSSPTAELYVPLDDVMGEYEFGIFSAVRCRGCIIWRQGNFRAVVYPSWNFDLSNGGGCLYGFLDTLCDLAEKKRTSGLDEKEQDMYDFYMMTMSLAFSYPLMSSSDDRFAGDTFKFIMDKWQESLKRASERLKKETPEDIAKNQGFERMMRENEESKEDKSGD